MLFRIAWNCGSQIAARRRGDEQFRLSCKGAYYTWKSPSAQNRHVSSTWQKRADERVGMALPSTGPGAKVRHREPTPEVRPLAGMLSMSCATALHLVGIGLVWKWLKNTACRYTTNSTQRSNNYTSMDSSKDCNRQKWVSFALSGIPPTSISEKKLIYWPNSLFPDSNRRIIRNHFGS